MYNRIILIGTIVDDPEEIYAPDASRAVYLSLKVSLPPDASPTYWGLIYDLRPPGLSSGWTVGDDTFLVICRDSLLIERCLRSFHKADVVCVEGRLVLTLLRCDGEPVPLAEILANDVIPLVGNPGSPSF